MKALTLLKDQLVYSAIRGVIAAASITPPDATLRAMGTVGRTFAAAPFNRKRLARAEEHLAQAFPDWTSEQKRRMAIRSYEHLMMLGIEVAYSPRLMNEEGWAERAHFGRLATALDSLLGGQSCVIVTGHVGNWELSGTFMAMLGFKMHALYRPLDLKPLDAWVRSVRSRRGLFLLDKFGAMREVPRVVANHESLAFVADQNAGDRGLFVPFFGRLASTYKAIAVTAHAYNLPVVVGWAKRVGGSDLAGDANCGQTLPSALRFDMHIADVFTPKDWADAPDPIFYITARYRRALESAFVEAPDQVLWMHRFWKSRPRHEREKKPFPAVLARKLRELPWLDDAKVEAIIECSNRDAAEYTPKKRRGSVESSTAGDLSADA